MAKLIGISVDVTKLDKSKFIVGAKGTYCNLTLDVKDAPDNYGNDCSIWLGQSQEERQAKVDRVFVGNGKVLWSGDSNKPAPQTPATPQGMPPINDDLPF